MTPKPKPPVPEALPAPTIGGSYEDGVLVQQTVEAGPTGIPNAPKE